MKLEAILFTVILLSAMIPIVAVGGRLKVSSRITVGAIVALWLGLAGLAVAAQFLWTDPRANPETFVINRPLQIPTGDYVGSDACRSCHVHNHATWHDSYHRTMTQVASEESVLGNFDNVELVGKDLSVRLFRKDKQFMAELTTSNRAVSGVYPVVMTTGSHTRQAYWLGSAPESRKMMMLPYMFLRAEKRWIPRHSGYVNPMCLQERPELSVVFADSGRWSQVCIKCHTTQGRSAPETDAVGKRPKFATASQAMEFGISCEACHGPGAEHVKVNSNPLHRYQQRLVGGPDDNIVNPARLAHDRSSEVCGQCHSVFMARNDAAAKDWDRKGFSFRPGDNLALDSFHFIVRGRPERMPAERPKDWRMPYDSGSFWSDGMSRASGREYNGLIESPCYQRGKMSCLSCHEMHQARGDPRPRADWADDQLKFGMDGNNACVQCHEQYKDAGRLQAHTHHAADSAGSICYNCHMPFTTYGILKAIRSHQIDTPSVQASLETGRPNACSQCHQDKTLAWAADHLADWYKIAKPKLSDDEKRIAATVLWTLRGDASQRALMAWSYGWEDGKQAAGSHWQAPFLAQLLDDRYDAVRYIAQRSLKRLPGYEDFEYDFVGTPEHRAAASKRALRIWGESQISRRPPFAREVLIDKEGKVVETEFQRLWKERNDGPVSVYE